MTFSTRDGSDFHGKKNIYFCCHPEDKDTYLQEIQQDIWHFINCAIWYDSDQEYTEEDLVLFSQEIDLVIVSVSKKFYETESVAKNITIPVFMETGTPILPIITDSDLFSVTNEFFNNRQVLDKFTKDDTSLGYYYKLEHYLRSVFLRNEIEEKTKNFFKNNIFISYRKKDRAIALGLMKKIHKNPLLHTLGIWYDEFLTPTEDFNKEIKSAIKNAGSMVMLITKNTLEENNYIITDEYPLAQSENKNIIGVLADNADKNLAVKTFPYISQYITLDDENLGSKISEFFQFELQVPSTPEDYYLLGCAYFGGISVEKNISYALEYLEKSANSHFSEAAFLLSDMYKQGLGVTPDSNKETDWLGKYVNIIIKEYKETPSQDTAYKVIDALLLFGDLMYYQGQDDRFNSIYKDLFNFTYALPGKDKHFEKIAIINNSYGVKQLNRENYAVAKEYFTEALKAYSNIPDGFEYETAELKYNIGSACIALNQTAEAEEALTSAIETFAVYSGKDPEKYNAIYLKALGNLAILDRNIFKATGNQTMALSAEGLMLKSIEIAEKMLIADKDVYLPLLAKSCDILAVFYMYTNRHEESLIYFIRAEEAYCEIIENGYKKYEIPYGQTLINCSTIHRITNQPEKALIYAKKAALIYKKYFTKAPHSFDKVYAKSLTVNAMIYTQLNMYQKASECFNYAIKIYNLTQKNDMSMLNDVAECCYEYSKMLVKCNEYREAKANCEFALQIFTKLEKEQPLYYGRVLKQVNEFYQTLTEVLPD